MPVLRLRYVLVLTLFCTITLCGIENKAPFSFSNVDLAFLEQANLMDKKLEKEGLVYHEDALSAYVTRVGLSMLPGRTPPERVNWQFFVLRDPMPNAFALPNGSVYVGTGLLSLLENEDQLASVLAHELTHVNDRHSYLGYRDYRKKAAIANIVSYAAGMAPGGSNWGSAIRLVASLVPAIMVASINGYSRELEHDADVYAFNKLVDGNYDPRELPNTFRLLQRKDEVDLVKSYYNDHPKLQDRISYTTNLISQKAPNELPADVLAARHLQYQEITETAVREDIHLSILSHKPRTALARALKLTEFHPASADNLYSLAETYRALGPWTPRPTDQELTGSGKKEIQNLKRKFTPDEEEQELLSRDSGRTTWQKNRDMAEQTYQKALAADPAHAKTYRGLAQLYDKEHKYKEALAAYQKYLELQPNALDQTRIRQRIEAMQRSAGQ